MSTSAQILAEFASGLEISTIPASVVERARDCIIDTVAAAAFGARFPWSRIVIEYARRYGEGGPCHVLGVAGTRLHAPCAALANGALAHAFEIDSVGSGPHPGSVLVPAVLAASEESGADGKTAIAAFVAGCELISRLGAAAHHNPEHIGFHAPGIIGTFGAAAAAARVYRLDAAHTANALGIAGSLSSGLLAFTKSRQGGMIKRLHMGRVSESGILAARLAALGYTGPETVLDGKFGFLDVFCRDPDARITTSDLGQTWQTSRICTKRYACHIFAQIPVQLLRELMAEHGFAGADVADIVVEGGEKLLSHHNIMDPEDIMKAQYSVPFCTALALFRNPDDPASFDASALEDQAIRDACRKVRLGARPQQGRVAWSAAIAVRLSDGREFTRDSDSFKGMPDNPLTPDELRRKFTLLTSGLGATESAQLYARLEHLESAQRVSLASS